MADTSRIEELRRRVQRDPASIAFAQLAEEYRRAGRYPEAIETCESGLAHHPGYLSARVTLGRSLLETGELESAQLELKQVLRAAPENLAALRGLAEIHHRRGELHEALAHYRTALEFARHDPELEHLVEQIQLELEPNGAAPVVVDGLSFQEVKDAFLNLSLPQVPGDPDGGSDQAVQEGAVEVPAAVHVAQQETAPEAGGEFVAEPASETAVIDAAGAELFRTEAASEAFATDAAAQEFPSETTPEAFVIDAAPEEFPSEATQAFVIDTAAEEFPAEAVSEPFVIDTALLGLETEAAPLVPSGEDPLVSGADAPAIEPPAEAQSAALPVPEPGLFPAVIVEPSPEPIAPAPVEPPEPVVAVAGAGVAGAPQAGAQVDALERWLEIILAERQRRS